MNPLWLLLIIPASAFFGFVLCAILTAGKQADWRAEISD